MSGWNEIAIAGERNKNQFTWLCFLVLISSGLMSSVAQAATFCDSLKKIIATAPNEFDDFRGQKLSSPEGLDIYLGNFTILGAESCAVSNVSVQGKRSSSGYTCSFKGWDSVEGLAKLQADIKTCVNIEVWENATAADGRVQSLAARYGLLKFSITHHGAAGLGLGVEVFRDDQGRVRGSPSRGSLKNGAGDKVCSAKTPDRIIAFIADYGEREGATFFQNAEFFGFTNDKSSPVVVFWTKQVHPAHPALIVRDVVREGEATRISARGDFAGDCLAFHVLLDQVAAMNKAVGTDEKGRN